LKQFFLQLPLKRAANRKNCTKMTLSSGATIKNSCDDFMKPRITSLIKTGSWMRWLMTNPITSLRSLGLSYDDQVFMRRTATGRTV
jgi:hypothetical protein